MPTTRWKWVQLTGRLARRSEEQGILSMLSRRSRGLEVCSFTGNMILDKLMLDTVSAREREEYNAVKTALSSGSCFNKGVYDSLQIIDAHGKISV